MRKLRPEAIREHRNRLGLTREELAERVGTVDVSSIKRWELGKTKAIRQENLECLARALGVASEMLVETVVPGLPVMPLPGRPDLVGRTTAINRIIELITAPDEAQIVTLWGPRGVGKTALALHCAQASAVYETYERIVWVTAKSHDLQPRGIITVDRSLYTVADLFYVVGLELGYRYIGTLSLAQQRIEALRLLAGHRVLLVVDNVDSLSPMERDALAGWLAQLPANTRALVTGRAPLGMLDEATFRVYPLSEEAALKLLSREAQARQVLLTDELCRLIFASVGGVPVLLKWCVGCIAITPRPTSETACIATHRTTDAYRWCFGELYNALPSDSCRLLLMAAAIGGTSITRGFLEAVAQVQGEAADKALTQLIYEAGLQQTEPDGGRFNLLPLTRESLLHNEVSLAVLYELRLRAAQYYTAIAATIGDNPNSNWTSLEPDLAGIIETAQWARENGEWLVLARLLREINQFLYTRYRWADMRALNDTVIRQKQVKLEPVLRADLLRDLAWLHIEYRAFSRAKRCAEEALTIFIQAGLPKYEATCLRYLAEIAVRKHQPAEAREYLLSSRRLAQQLADNGNLLAMTDNLIGATYEQEGNTEVALRFYRRSLRLRQALNPPDRWGACVVLRNIGAAHLNKGDYARADAYLRRCIATCGMVQRHDLCGAALLLRARACSALGDQKTALALVHEAERIFSGMDHKDNLRAARRLLRELQTNGKRETVNDLRK